MRDFHKPVFFDGLRLDHFEEARDPVTINRIAHDTAHLLLERSRSAHDESLVRRLTHYTDEHGLDTIAELWANASERSLAGILWRVYLLRSVIMQRPGTLGELYDLGRASVSIADEVIAGVADPVGPDEVRTTSEEILRGVFAGDLAVALRRAAAFAHLVALGCLRRADVLDAFDVEQASAFTLRARRFDELSVAFARGAQLWQEDALD